MEIKRATPDMFEAIHEVLKEFGGPLTRDDWRRLVDYQFSDQDYRGWVSIDRGEVVGFLGAVFSRRGAERFCGLTSWITKKSHRKANLHILMPMLELKDHTLLNYSASPFTYELFKKRLGFEVLDDQLLVIPAVTPRLTPNGIRRVKAAADIERVLDARQLELWRDHLPYPVTHLVLEGPEGHCYAVASKTLFRNKAPCSYLHHVSNPALFAKAVNLAQRELLKENGTLFTAVDSRLMQGEKIRGAFRWTLAQPRLYRPSTPKPENVIDSLYTELVLLNPSRWSYNH
ncbi:MAG: hypothetical protein JNK82_37990 [Myxococcaceae bacterium]|nr:hypothetical protein [Myxococcaceae bacterium]